VRSDGAERVEYAIKFPADGEQVLLPIDSKFPARTMTISRKRLRPETPNWLCNTARPRKQDQGCAKDISSKCIASTLLAKVQACLELGDLDGIGIRERTAVDGYNRDDCFSAWRLRDWLEKVRSQVIEAGTVIDRPSAKSGDAGEDLTDWQQKIAILVNRLTHDVPLEREEQTAEQRARWILAHVLDWHRREDKPRGGSITA
jgi:hypothetical protein